MRSTLMQAEFRDGARLRNDPFVAAQRRFAAPRKPPFIHAKCKAGGRPKILPDANRFPKKDGEKRMRKASQNPLETRNQERQCGGGYPRSDALMSAVNVLDAGGRPLSQAVPVMTAHRWRRDLTDGGDQA